MRIRRLLCWIGFHGVRQCDKQYSPRAYRIVCVDCGKRHVMNDELRVCLPWDESFERFYDEWNSHRVDT